MNNEQPIYLNTWVIVLAFIFFWPLGVALLIMRANSNKKNMFDGSTTSKICYIVGGILVLAGLGSFGDSFFRGLFWTAGGIAVIYYGAQNKKKVERYKKYIDLIANQGVRSLDTISNTLNITYSVTKSDIETLIAKGTFKGARIDELTRSIELNAIPTMQTNNGMPGADGLGGFINAISGMAGEAGMGGNNAGSSQSVVATCPGCGGTMPAFKGATVECDYCGKIYSA